MTVYVDSARHPFKGYIMCHMTADTLSELHGMADALEMKREWFQAPPKASHPHYDIPEHRRAQAIFLGAVEVDVRTGLHFAARLGLEWAQQRQDEIRMAKYQKTLLRTERHIQMMSYQNLIG